MHMGNMAITGGMQPKNYIHIIFNNGAHDSVGGQPTVGLDINFMAIATALGYRHAIRPENTEQLEEALQAAHQMEGPVLIEARVRKGNRKDLGRPTTTPVQNKEALMAFLTSKD